ncbi:hypothetical protein LXA43DRAFT_1090919 [Ganoderma leucocontextum]|nr:hypothetical protein LXA43DRAFT_1090919 [Ganoderma leucocontextum]
MPSFDFTTNSTTPGNPGFALPPVSEDPDPEFIDASELELSKLNLSLNATYIQVYKENQVLRAHLNQYRPKSSQDTVRLAVLENELKSRTDERDRLFEQIKLLNNTIAVMATRPPPASAQSSSTISLSHPEHDECLTPPPRADAIQWWNEDEWKVAVTGGRIEERGPHKIWTFLEHEDGALVSQSTYQAILKCQYTVFHTLLEEGRAPFRWGLASEYVTMTHRKAMCRQFPFLKQGLAFWKVRTLATKYYPNWAHKHMPAAASNNAGVTAATPTAEKRRSQSVSTRQSSKRARTRLQDRSPTRRPSEAPAADSSSPLANPQPESQGLQAAECSVSQEAQVMGQPSTITELAPQRSPLASKDAPDSDTLSSKAPSPCQGRPEVSTTVPSQEQVSHSRSEAVSLSQDPPDVSKTTLSPSPQQSSDPSQDPVDVSIPTSSLQQVSNMLQDPPELSATTLSQQQVSNAPADHAECPPTAPSVSESTVPGTSSTLPTPSESTPATTGSAKAARKPRINPLAKATLRLPQPAPEANPTPSPTAPSGSASNALPSSSTPSSMPTSMVQTAEGPLKFTRYNPNSFSARNLFLKDYLSQRSVSKTLKEEFEAAWTSLDSEVKQEYEAQNKAEKERRKAARAPGA